MDIGMIFILVFLILLFTFGKCDNGDEGKSLPSFTKEEAEMYYYTVLKKDKSQK